MEADRAIYGPESFVPADWVPRAQAALAVRSVPGFSPTQLFKPRNLLPFLFAFCALAFGMLPARLGYGTQNLTVFVEDVDAHYDNAREAGARIVEELHETVYGERQYGAEDLDGHLWLFSRHARDVSPEEWGARMRAKD